MVGYSRTSGVGLGENRGTDFAPHTSRSARISNRNALSVGEPSFLEQLVAGQYRPERQCGNTHEGRDGEKLMKKSIRRGNHFLNILWGHCGYSERVRKIDASDSNEANPGKHKT